MVTHLINCEELGFNPRADSVCAVSFSSWLALVDFLSGQISWNITSTAPGIILLHFEKPCALSTSVEVTGETSKKD